MDAASTPTPAPEPEGVQAPSAAEGDGQECPWCRFMKAGPCGEVFSAWQSCVDDAGDVADAEGRKQAINTCAAVVSDGGQHGVVPPRLQRAWARPEWHLTLPALWPRLKPSREPPLGSCSGPPAAPGRAASPAPRRRPDERTACALRYCLCPAEQAPVGVHDRSPGLLCVTATQRGSQPGRAAAWQRAVRSRGRGSRRWGQPQQRRQRPGSGCDAASTSRSCLVT